MIVYIATFLLAFGTLAFEVTLTRLLSVVTWYHLAFFAISTAMLGMTAGAITVYLRPRWFAGKNLRNAISLSCLLFGASVPVSLLILCDLNLTVSFNLSGLAHLFIMTLACSCPFYFFGMAITAVLTKDGHPIGYLYASDLLGASAGALFVLAGLELMDAPSLILLCGVLGALAGLLFSRGQTVQKTCLAGFLVLAAIGMLSLTGAIRIHPKVIKGEKIVPSHFILEKWNSHSHVLVYVKIFGDANLWGPSPATPPYKSWQYIMRIDGDAGTSARRFASLEDIEHLQYDVTNMAYYLRNQKGSACIIGVGGGKDIQGAILFGMKRIVGVEVNPIFVGLHKGLFRDFTNIANRKDVTLITDDGRSALSRMKEKFTVVQMALIDTWAATGAGAFSLSENGLYTVEAWKIFFNRLDPDGIFTVSRWYNPDDLNEAGRTLSLAVAALLDMGVSDPSRHIAMIASQKVATILVSKKPFPAEDIEKIHEVCRLGEFNPVIVPEDRCKQKTLDRIVHAATWADLQKAVDGSNLDLSPATDSRPFFFNQLRLRNIFNDLPVSTGVIHGNRIASAVLLGLILCLAFLACAAILVPLLLSPRTRGEKPGGRAFWAGALYFSLIGAGFMLAEIAFIQRLSIFLGHPVYSLGVLLFTMIAATGMGSMASESLPLARRPWKTVFPFLGAFMILAVRFASAPIMDAMQASGMPARILASISLIGPLGVVLGFFFPTGMKIIQDKLGEQSPWYWALNGVFGVLCSALAVFLSIHAGIYCNLYLAAGCYALTAPCLYIMGKDVVTAAQGKEASP